MGTLHEAFQTDYFIKDNRYAYGDLTFWLLNFANNYELTEHNYSNRMQGHSKNYLLNKMHMTNHPYPPFFLYKLLNCSESSLIYLINIIKDIHSIIKQKKYT